MGIHGIEWNHIDIVFAIVMLFMLLRGLLRGALAELFSVGAIVAGIAVAVIFSAGAGAMVEEKFGLAGWGSIIAFLGLFLVTYVVMKLVEKTLRSFVESVKLQNLDKALGLLLGLVEGLAIVAVVIFVMRLQPVFDFREILAGSLFVRLLDPLVGFVVRNV
jgi:membrane protein required for colicin V production